MWLIVGLGNPGKKYRETRHNAGFHVIDDLSGRYSIPVEVPLYMGRNGRGQIQDQCVVLLKPYTYMNRSGLCVSAAVRGYDISLDRLIVVHDDIDIQEGTLRVKEGGGSGGHRGIESVIWALGTGEFPRLRVGIGRPPEGRDAASYVLEPLSFSDLSVFKEHCSRAAEAMETLILHGAEETKRLFHGKGSKGFTEIVL